MRHGIKVTAPPPPFAAFNTESAAFPLLLSVPHAGRNYPPDLLASCRVDPGELVRLEDRYADRLVQPAIAAGFPAIIAQCARAAIDLNRAEQDMDAAMIVGTPPTQIIAGPKTRGGLGLLPRRLSGAGELWRGPLPWSAVEARIDAIHRPFHDAVAQSLSALRQRFGIALLLDVHSMPPPAASDNRHWVPDAPARIVIGDRFGRSAAGRFAATLMDVARAHAIPVALNHPYPGDYILTRHGRPQHNVHAVQLEIDRSLYLGADLREPCTELSSIADMVTQMALALVDEAQGGALAQAAE
jgi:N-formylglutamate amidohydrolase